MNVLNLLLCFFITFSLSVALIPAVIFFTKKTKLSDEVNHRSAHTVTTPRGGGLIFIFATALMLIVNFIHPLLNMPQNIRLILYLSFACSLIGFLDDKFSLPSWLRFCGQILLVVYPSVHLPLLFSAIPASVQYSLYVISWVWFINLFNFMDGTDGYAAQESIFILAFSTLVLSSLSSLALCIIGAVLGFLMVNYPKAKIFMGDAGSYFLGYLLFGMLIYSFTLHPHLLLPSIIVSLLFTADATYTLIKRIIKKESFFSAHRSHWYQRVYNMDYTHKRIFWLGVLINFILLLLALLSVYMHHRLADLIIAVVVITFSALYIVYTEKKYKMNNI